MRIPIDILIWALVCLGILLVIGVIRHCRLSVIRRTRENWSPELFYRYVEGHQLPKFYCDELLSRLQDRVQTGFPVMPRDSLAFFDVGTYVSAMEDEFVLDFCKAVSIVPPTSDEVLTIQEEIGRINTVDDLIIALGMLFKLRAGRYGKSK